MAVRGLAWRSAARLLPRCLLPLCVLGACAVGGPSFEQMQSYLPAVPAGEARIVLFRQPNYFGMAVWKDIRIDGRPMGSLASGSFIVARHAPGQVRVTMVNDFLTPDYGFSFTVEAGKTTYVEFQPNASVADGALMALLVRAEHPEFCGPGWCAAREDAAEALPKLRGLKLAGGSW